MKQKDTKIDLVGNLTFCDVLCLIFIVLKLTHVISWSWWWVLSPIWIEILVIIIVLVAFKFMGYF